MMPLGFTCIENIKESIEKAERGESKLNSLILGIPGMSSPRVRHFLNNLCSHFKNQVYLEVGCYKGSTLISAIYGNEMIPVSIENWSEFDSPREECLKNLTKWLPDMVIGFIEKKFTDVNPEDLVDQFGKVSVYFYDGSHDVQSQIQAFVHFNSIFEDTFIAIIDDWNMDGVKEGTRIAFKTLKYSVIQEWELPARFNGDNGQWWNGLLVSLIRK